MAVPGPAFANVTGTPSDPLFAEIVYRGHTVESNGSLKKSFNVFHMRRRASTPGADPIDVYNGFVTAFNTPLIAAISDKYIGDNVSVRLMDNPMTTPYIAANAITGAVTGDRMPSGNGAVTIQLKTNGRGRNFRGSKHFSPIAESQTTLDNLNGGAQTLWDAVASALAVMSPLIMPSGVEWDLIVLSQELSDFVINPSVFTGAYVIDCIANAQVGTMKRRRQKAGT